MHFPTPLIAAVLAAILAGCSPQKESPRSVISERDWILGVPSAPISLILYSDGECSACKEYAGTPEEIAALYKGSVNVVLRHFPQNDNGPAAIAAAIATECVGAQAGPEGAFSFFYGYSGSTQGAGKGLPGGVSSLSALAKSYGASDSAAFGACLSSAGAQRRVMEDIADARSFGLSQAPATIVRSNVTGASWLFSGAADPRALVEAIQAAAKSSIDSLPSKTNP